MQNNNEKDVKFFRFAGGWEKEDKKGNPQLNFLTSPERFGLKIKAVNVESGEEVEIKGFYIKHNAYKYSENNNSNSNSPDFHAFFALNGDNS